MDTKNLSDSRRLKVYANKMMTQLVPDTPEFGLVHSNAIPCLAVG